MIWRFSLALIGLFFAAAAPAQAQSGSAGNFCAAAPVETLQSLDGSWRITQGPGLARAAGMAIPLPGHPAQALSLDYDPLSGTALLEGAAPDELLVLLPASAEDAGIAAEALAENGGAPANGGECNWASLPLMIGSNVYELRPGPQSTNNAVYGQVLGFAFGYCYNGSIDPSESSFQIFEGGLGPIPLPVYAEESTTNACNPPPEAPRPAPGQMVMTMIVRFDSQNSGSGLLLFEGRQGGNSFSATAPITISR
ncbi:hypothetical protein [Parasphingopyxis marina]|uniref:Uncharacterized protein n=1 Tax=Parasphingopyxis marina TaxID=2761622 RepID=A0A842I133_9SPHN|nr:hypothetical protein [Parasphingopyxis marina]MBC2778577.1 hypothetical protein [Parasphingopyxis marina]